MNVEIPTTFLRAIKRADLIPSYWSKEIAEVRKVSIDIFEKFNERELEQLKDFSLENYKKKEDDPTKITGISSLYSKFTSSLRFVKSGDTLEVNNLEQLKLGLRKWVLKTSPERRWIFAEANDGKFLPCWVAGIELIRADRHTPEHVNMITHFVKRDEEVGYLTFTFYGRNFAEAKGAESSDDDDDGEDEKKKAPKQKVKRGGVPIDLFLHKHGIYPDSPETYQDYLASVKSYSAYARTVGTMASGEGTGWKMSKNDDDDDHQWWRHRFQSVELQREGELAQLVTDDQDDESLTIEYYHFFARGSGWGSTKDDDGSEEGEEDTKLWGLIKKEVPIHPYVVAFDLVKHYHVMVHTDNLKPRQFDPTMKDKLVLPQDDLSFIDLLMNSAGIELEDIVKGKTGGVIVLSSGAPGTGKTLTAEIYAESLKKPLYTVQCSQLGVNPEELEKKLKKVLARSERWSAILLLDEADVYIRQRGEDLVQNAIVGVFLRVLEYYSGVLFMTTNKSAADIDDAIVSRATASLRYSNPTGDLLVRIWKVLSEQFKVVLSDADIAELCKIFPKISGRDVKNLLKLTKFITVDKHSKATAKIVEWVARFNNITAVT